MRTFRVRHRIPTSGRALREQLFRSTSFVRLLSVACPELRYELIDDWTPSGDEHVRSLRAIAEVPKRTPLRRLLSDAEYREEHRWVDDTLYINVIPLSAPIPFEQRMVVAVDDDGPNHCNRTVSVEVHSPTPIFGSIAERFAERIVRNANDKVADVLRRGTGDQSFARTHSVQ